MNVVVWQDHCPMHPAYVHVCAEKPLFHASEQHVFAKGYKIHTLLHGVWADLQIYMLRCMHLCANTAVTSFCWLP